MISENVTTTFMMVELSVRDAKAKEVKMEEVRTERRDGQTDDSQRDMDDCAIAKDRYNQTIIIKEKR